jgi:hypothetical protein
MNKPVIILYPEDKRGYSQDCIRDCHERGETITETAETLIVFEDYGLTQRMIVELNKAILANRKIQHRKLYQPWKIVGENS